jgi:hypothetical protein
MPLKNGIPATRRTANSLNFFSEKPARYPGRFFCDFSAVLWLNIRFLSGTVSRAKMPSRKEIQLMTALSLCGLSTERSKDNLRMQIVSEKTGFTRRDIFPDDG